MRRLLNTTIVQDAWDGVYSSIDDQRMSIHRGSGGRRGQPAQLGDQVADGAKQLILHDPRVGQRGAANQRRIAGDLDAQPLDDPAVLPIAGGEQLLADLLGERVGSRQSAVGSPETGDWRLETGGRKSDGMRPLSTCPLSFCCASVLCRHRVIGSASRPITSPLPSAVRPTSGRRIHHSPVGRAHAIIVTTSKYHEAPMTENPILEPPVLRSFDGLPVRAATLDMIDMEKVAAHIQGCFMF